MASAPPSTGSAVDGLLAWLDREQRAAATLPNGPAQIIAPAGSGKTTTLIARLGVLLGRGVAADRIGVVTFNREAAEELSSRIATRLSPHVPAAEAIEVRTLHAMARQVLLDAGRPVRLLADRLPLLRAARRSALADHPIVGDSEDPPPEPPDPAALDTIVSAWKVEGRAPPANALATDFGVEHSTIQLETSDRAGQSRWCIAGLRVNDRQFLRPPHSVRLQSLVGARVGARAQSC